MSSNTGNMTGTNTTTTTGAAGNNTGATKTIATPAAGPTTSPSSTLAPIDYTKMTPADLFQDLIVKIGADKVDPTFTTFLGKTFSGYITSPDYATDYDGSSKYYSKISDIGKKITELDNQLKSLIPDLQTNYRRMVQNLIKVQIYSHYDKVVKEQKETPAPEDNKKEYEKMVTDILDLVNKSLDQSNQVFENRLGRREQKGGSSTDTKVNVMGKYFNYKLKYMMLKNSL